MKKEMNPLSAAIVSSSSKPLLFDSALCSGCNRCVEVCQVDILIPNSQKGAPPVILYPGECYYCGSCAMECPKPGAVKLQHPLMNRAKFVDIKCPGE